MLTPGLALVVWLAANAGAHAGALSASVLPPIIGLTERLPAHYRTGFAMDGLDPVSFFLPQGPVSGRSDHEALHGGLAWRFSSAANRAAFAAAPQRFVPRVGGHDPVALARSGRLVQARASHYAVVDGRLYLFRDARSRAKFLADPAVAEAAERTWIAARRQLVSPIARR